MGDEGTGRRGMEGEGTGGGEEEVSVAMRHT